jgi:hypothetical protein
MHRFERLRKFHVALVGKFIDRGVTRTLCIFDHIIFRIADNTMSRLLGPTLLMREFKQ